MRHAPEDEENKKTERVENVWTVTLKESTKKTKQEKPIHFR
jgi:hypothetical protein